MSWLLRWVESWGEKRALKQLTRKNVQEEVDFLRLFVATTHHSFLEENACSDGRLQKFPEGLELARCLDEAAKRDGAEVREAVRTTVNRHSLSLLRQLATTTAGSLSHLPRHGNGDPCGRQPDRARWVSLGPSKFWTYVDESTIRHSSAGAGVFVEGTVKPGAVVAFYPGVVYLPTQVPRMADYPNITLHNDYLAVRYDSSVVDALGWFRYDDAGPAGGPSDDAGDDDDDDDGGGGGGGGISGGGSEDHRNKGSSSSSTTPITTYASGRGGSQDRAVLSPSARARRPWMMSSDRPSVATVTAGRQGQGQRHGREESQQPSSLPLSERPGTAFNPLALGHIINHPPKGTKPNVLFTAIDLTESDVKGHEDVLPLFPNRPYAPPSLIYDARVVARGLAIVATRELNDEELFVNYRYNPKIAALPAWYSAVDASEDERRWAK